MSRQPPKKPRPAARERARDEKEPGAHSGAESTAQDRVVPGTASAREGYQAEGGTAHGEALEGVEKGDTGRLSRGGRRRAAEGESEDR
ncbi:hypothetical protein [Streptomyces sp. 8N706]|uniref:hypothetical protein n=1 Tax=Streptomyces sp. 8N706 TaxID=3457416 RepID=UPI003FD4BB5A